jgi:ribosome-associated protein
MVELVRISDDLSIPLDDIEFAAIKSQGSGGQNVNKVATAIHLRFDIDKCKALSESVKERLHAMDDSRISSAGIVIIKAQQYRSQDRNKRAAIERLQDLIRSALIEEKPRVQTKPSNRSRKQRVDTKRRRGQLKIARGKINDD